MLSKCGGQGSVRAASVANLFIWVLLTTFRWWDELAGFLKSQAPTDRVLSKRTKFILIFSPR